MVQTTQPEWWVTLRSTHPAMKKNRAARFARRIRVPEFQRIMPGYGLRPDPTCALIQTIRRIIKITGRFIALCIFSVGIHAHAAPESRVSRVQITKRERTHNRKPQLLYLSSGLYQYRAAQRTDAALMIYEPPRRTRDISLSAFSFSLPSSGT